MSRYANLENLIADYIPEAKSAREIAAVGRILDSASAFVDSYCKRPSGYFSAAESSAVATAKRVRGEGHNFLRLPRHVFGTASIQDFPATSNYYESEVSGWIYLDAPLQNAFEGDESIINGADYYPGNACPRFAQSKIYLVSAIWGFSAVPLEIVEAVRLITSRIYSVQKGTIGQVTAEGFINERLIPQAAKDLLAGFIKREFER